VTYLQTKGLQYVNFAYRAATVFNQPRVNARLVKHMPTSRTLTLHSNTKTVYSIITDYIQSPNTLELKQSSYHCQCQAIKISLNSEVSHCQAIVTTVLSCTICEISKATVKKAQIFHIRPVTQRKSKLHKFFWYGKMIQLSGRKEFLCLGDTILACDKQTDRQIPSYTVVFIMHTCWSHLTYLHGNVRMTSQLR